MNLRPPPSTNNINELYQWCSELYEYLKYPHIHQLRLIPRATASESVEGVIYLDSDDDTLKCHNGTDFQDCY